MPKLTQINSITTPEKFCVLNAEGEYVDYVIQTHHPVTDVAYNTGLRYNRKSKKGEWQIANYGNCFKVFQVVGDVSELICVGNLFHETWNGTTWNAETYGDATATLPEGRMVATQTNADSSFVIDTDLRTNKTTLTATGAGTKKRISLLIRHYNGDAETGIHPDYIWDDSDYTGNKSVTSRLATAEEITAEENAVNGQVGLTGWSTIYFEPDGVDTDSFEVDPYIGVAIESTYIDVTCDGYILRIQTTSIWLGLVSILDPTGTDTWARCDPGCRTSTQKVSISYDSSRSIKIVEDTPLRAVIDISGNFKQNDGTVLSSSTSVDWIVTIFTDRIVIDFTWVVGSAIILGSYDQNNQLMCADIAVTGPANIAEDGSGAEVAYGDWATIDNGRTYRGWVSDEINITESFFVGSSATNMLRRSRGPGNTITGFGSGTIAAGTHNIVNVLMLDSAERETTTPATAWTDTNFSAEDLVVNDSIGYECISAVTSGDSGVTEPGTGSAWTTYWRQCHKYTVADRLTFGDDFTTLTNNTPTTGDWLTTLPGDADIISGGWGTDGCPHVEE